LRMKQHYLGGDEYLRPTSITYNMASSAFTWVGQFELANGLLEEIDLDYLAGNDSAKPDVILFDIVLESWSKSRSCDMPQPVDAILEEYLVNYLTTFVSQIQLPTTDMVPP
jgi:hypothetical protein